MEGRLFLRAFLFRGILWGYQEICKMPSKRASLSIGALLGNLEGDSFAGIFERKVKIYLGSFLGPRGHFLSLRAIWNFSKGTGLS